MEAINTVIIDVAACEPTYLFRDVPKLKSPWAIAGESHAIASTPGTLLLPLVNHFS